MHQIKNTFLYINLYIHIYGTIISSILFCFVNYILLNNYIIENNNINEDAYLNLSSIAEIDSNIYLDDKKGSNIMKMKKLGERSSSIVSTNGSKNVTKLSHLVNTNSNTIKFDTNKYSQSREITKNPSIQICNEKIELGQIVRNPNVDWKDCVYENVSKKISLKAIDIPDVKFTEEELNNRMDLTQNSEKRAKVIKDLEDTKDIYISKIFLDVKIYYYSINKLEYYESFLLDYYTSSDVQMKVNNIAAEMEQSKSVINTQYNTNNFKNINSPKEESAAFVSTLLNPYNHFCMYYYGPNGEQIFSTLTHASGIVHTKLNNNILVNVFNNDYKFHLISDKGDFKGGPKNQYATSFMYQENQIPGLINNINLADYNTLYNFINRQDVYEKLEKLVSLKYMSDSEITINKLKQVGIIT